MIKNNTARFRSATRLFRTSSSSFDRVFFLYIHIRIVRACVYDRRTRSVPRHYKQYYISRDNETVGWRCRDRRRPCSRLFPGGRGRSEKKTRCEQCVSDAACFLPAVSVGHKSAPEQVLRRAPFVFRSSVRKIV